MQLKRHSPLFAEWQSDGLYIIAPKDGKTRLKLGRKALKILTELSSGTSRDAILRQFASAPSDESQVQHLLDTLIEHDVIVENNVDYDSGSLAPPWDGWGTIAMLYHKHSRNARYLTDVEDKRSYIAQITAVNPPRGTKSYQSAQRIFLPRTRRRLSASLEEVLTTRRTHRDFQEAPVVLEDLSILLQLTFGPQIFVDGRAFGTLQRRTSPNAGARQEIECYIAALNVQELPSGLYHYNVIEHSLELLSMSITREEIRHIIYDAPMADTSPLFCFTSAMTDRISYKYQHGRAYRLWMYNIGHVGQTFVLTATALGLGAFQTAAFRDAEADVLLGLDGESEFVTYVLGCGFVDTLGRPTDCLAPPPR